MEHEEKEAERKQQEALAQQDKKLENELKEARMDKKRMQRCGILRN